MRIYVHIKTTYVAPVIRASFPFNIVGWYVPAIFVQSSDAMILWAHADIILMFRDRNNGNAASL